MSERDYVLGTHDEEIERLGLQHRLWRARVLAAWRRAGFDLGQTLLDLGCGPGHATVDLAETVGRSGRVVAVDRSRRFLDALLGERARRGLLQIETVELDLDEATLPALAADGAWARWAFAFLRRPRELLAKIHGALRPGAPLVVHEYFDYRTWRLAPRSAEFETFVAAVMESWRAAGGEPDVGLDLPRWLAEAGFTVRSIEPVVEIVTPADPLWQWPRSFVATGVERLVELGRLSPERAQAIRQAFAAREAEEGTLVVTPALVEIIALRR